MIASDLRVLVAHWDTSARQRIRNAFRHAGCERVMLARTPREAAGRLAEGPYDVFITALTFPNMKAWSSVHMVRSGRFCHPGLPIAVVIDEHRDIVMPSEAVEHAVTLLSLADVGRTVAAAQAAIDGTGKPSVLVVEDDAYMARYIAESLRDLYRMENASDGESGLDLWESKHHALVMLDIMLPRRSGIEVLDRIHAADRDQPVIVLTAYGTAERYNDCVARGATLFLEKPVEGVKLRVTCESVLRRRDYEEISAWLARTQRGIEDVGHSVTAADAYLSSGRVQKAHTELKAAISAFLNALRAARGPGRPGDKR